ncbi:unnamed protein product [Ranitomeya imitator]|uniref:Uncharacterized protein n=1 Tax=Ranitomeya imitator TaxID=111125 RepID=A0ABN9M6X5_9NEOB|nr:unnamed protein product [Ranitomeya imitator]
MQVYSLLSKFPDGLLRLLEEEERQFEKELELQKSIDPHEEGNRRRFLEGRYVLSGDENQEFNVLVDAFNDIDCISSGEAERTLVFWLVLMVNLTGVVPERAKTMLAIHIPDIQSRLYSLTNQFPLKVPKRLVDIIGKLGASTKTEDLISLLQELLALVRDDERLVECSWRWDIAYGKGQVRGIFFDDKFRFSKFSYVRHSIHDNRANFLANEQEYFEEEKIDLVAAVAADRQKQIAVRQLHLAFLVARISMKWKNASKRRQKYHMEEYISDYFKIANVDKTQCDLCGVKFLHIGTLPTQGEIEEDLEDVSSPAVDIEIPNLPGINEEYENHIVLERHRKQMNDYSKYLDFFKLEVDTAIDNGKSLIQTMGETSRNKLTSKEELHLEKTKIENKIKVIGDLMENIYEKKTWSEAEYLMQTAVNDLTASIAESLKLLEKSQQPAPRTEGPDTFNIHLSSFQPPLHLLQSYSALTLRQRARINHVTAPSDLSVTAEDVEDGAAAGTRSSANIFRSALQIIEGTCTDNRHYSITGIQFKTDTRRNEGPARELTNYEEKGRHERWMATQGSLH